MRTYEPKDRLRYLNQRIWFFLVSRPCRFVWLTINNRASVEPSPVNVEDKY
jgi:hypothetical protein